MKSHLEVVESKHVNGRSVADGVKAGIVRLCIRPIVFCQPPPFTLQALVTPPLCPLTLHCGAVAGSCMAVWDAVIELAGRCQASPLEPADGMLCSGSTERVLSRSPRAQLCICPGSHGHLVAAPAQIAGSPAPCTAAQMVCHKLANLTEWWLGESKTVSSVGSLSLIVASGDQIYACHE